jgi:hypothetical protein
VRIPAASRHEAAPVLISAANASTAVSKLSSATANKWRIQDRHAQDLNKSEVKAK